MADDDDVSEIEVSDDEESPNKHAATATGQPARPPNADSSSHHGSSGSKYGKAGSAEGGSRSRDRRNGRHQGHNAAGRVDETLYEDDEEGHAAEDGYEVAGDEAYDDFEDEEEGHDGQAGDRFDEEALDYFYSRKRAGQAPKTWLEVDEGEIREVADNLLQNINRAYQSENVLQQIFASSLAANGQELVDPLGGGAIDPLTMKLTSAQHGPVDNQPVVNNKWHRGKRAPKQASDGGDEGAGEQGVSAMSALPPEVSPSHEDFNPELYLATFHADTGLKELRQGMKHLEAEVSERTGQHKELIKRNFERFISCKGTIDDIYLKLNRIQSADHMGSTQLLQDAIEKVQETAQSTFGDVLQRAAKADRVRSVSTLLRRFNNLFGMPSRIRSLAAEGDLEQIVREYRRANALIMPSANTPNVWISLYREIEKSVVAVYSQAQRQLQSLTTPVGEVPVLIVALAELAAQNLPGTREEDPMKLYLGCVKEHLTQHLEACDVALDNELNELSVASRKLYRQSTFATSFSVAAAATSAAAAAAQAAPASAAASLRDLLDEMDRGVAEPEEGEEGDGVASSSNRQLLLWQGPPDWVPKDRDKDGSLSPHLAEAMAARVAAAAAAAASAAAASRGPGPGPGAGMLALGDKVVRVSGVGDPGGAPAAAGLSEAAASAQGAGLGSALLAAVAPRFTPVQFAWVRCMARMSAELCHALPAVWSVCTSPRLTQSKADLSGASRKSIERAAALGRDLVSKAVAALVERAEDALQELSHAGPMQPCMELVMVDLAHTWHVLHDAGCPDDCIQPLTGCLLKGLGLYTRSLAALLRHGPQALLREEEWMVGAPTRDSLASTQLPGRLQALVAVCMRSYSSMLQVTTSVAEPTPDVTWAPLQRGVFAAVHTYCMCALQLAEELGGAGWSDSGVLSHRRGRLGQKRGSGRAVPAKANGVADGDDDDELDTADKVQDDGTDGAGSRQASLPLANGSGRLAGQGSGTTLSLDAAGDGGGPVPHAALQQQCGAEKLLACMSNAIALRTRVVPLLADLHRHLLTGPPEGQGSRPLQQRLQASGTELKQLVSSLLAVYLRLKQGELAAALQLYLARPAAPGTSAAGAAAPSRAAPPQRAPPGPGGPSAPQLSGVSSGLRHIMSCLYSTYTQVYANAPLMLQPVMAAVSGHLFAMLVDRYSSMDSQATDVDQLLQLFLDLAYVERALGHAMGQGTAVADAHAAYETLGGLMLEAMTQKGFRPRSAMARVLAGVNDVQQVVSRAHSMLRDVVRSLVQRHAVNIKCFE